MLLKRQKHWLALLRVIFRFACWDFVKCSNPRRINHAHCTLCVLSHKDYTYNIDPTEADQNPMPNKGSVSPSVNSQIVNEGLRK
jgi:hypothetical protein